MWLENSGKGSWFQLKLVCCFQMALKTFLYTSRKCSRYLKHTPDSNRYVSKKKSDSHNTSIGKYKQKRCEKNFHNVYELRNFYQF